MVMRAPRGGMNSFTRGAEIWMHQARMTVVAIIAALVGALVIAAVTAGLYFAGAATPLEKYALERNLSGKARLFLHMTAGKMELHVDGAPRKMEVGEVVAATDFGAAQAWVHVKNSALIGALVGAGAMLLVIVYWIGYGREKMADSRLRGASLVSGEDLARIMKRRDDTSPYEIAGVPMRKKAETLHTLILGAQGTGKSQQIFHLMEQVRARGKRAIVYDPTGEYTQVFYREGTDILMNPLDGRSPNWNIWNEIHKDYHFDNMANGLIPDPAQADPFWAHAGRMVLKDVYRVLGREGRRTNRDLYNAIALNALPALHALLQGTAGATYVDPTTERTGMSLKMTVQNQLESFRFLHDEGPLFSIRQWVTDESDSWLFITAREAQRDAMKPLLSLWIDIAIKAVLDLEPIHRERLWFFIDELPTLQKLDILKLALTNTRKYGLCMVVGIQDFSQLHEIYGRELAKTIISGCQTKLLLRVTDGSAARQLAETMGQAEMDEKEETLSYGLHAERDGVSVFARRSLRDIVLSSEVLTLPDMAGYLQTPGDYPIARVQYAYRPRAKLAAAFIERDGLNIAFPTRAKLAGVMATSPPASGDEALDLFEEADGVSPAKVAPADARPAHNPLADAL